MSDIFKKGSFVKFTDSDEDGEYSFVGQIQRVDNKAEMIHLYAEKPYGEIGLPFSDKSNMTSAKKPRGWKVPSSQSINRAARPRKKTEITVISATSTKGKTKMPKTGSKGEQVLNIVRANADKSRKELIDIVVDQIGMTPAGASTYVSNSRKLLK